MKLPGEVDLANRDPLGSALHDLTNALAAARSYGELAHLKAKGEQSVDPRVLADLLEELDRANDIVRRVRRETFRPGDVLECNECGHEFVYRKSGGRKADCRRCGSSLVEKAMR